MRVVVMQDEIRAVRRLSYRFSSVAHERVREMDIVIGTDDLVGVALTLLSDAEALSTKKSMSARLLLRKYTEHASSDVSGAAISDVSHELA